MAHSAETNGASELVDEDPHLDVALLDALMIKQGAKKKAEHARRFRIDCTHYFTLRSHDHTPSLKTARRMARVAGTSIGALFFGDET